MWMAGGGVRSGYTHSAADDFDPKAINDFAHVQAHADDRPRGRESTKPVSFFHGYAGMCRKWTELSESAGHIYAARILPMGKAVVVGRDSDSIQRFRRGSGVGMHGRGNRWNTGSPNGERSCLSTGTP